MSSGSAAAARGERAQARHAGNSPQAAAALPLLAERSAKPGRADLSARRLRHAGSSPQAAAALPLLAERSAKPGRADLSARRLRHAGNSPQAAAALPLLAERSAKPGRADLSARRLRHAGNSPQAAAALPLLAERSASLGALISARAGSACRQLSASSGSAAAARGEVREPGRADLSARRLRHAGNSPQAAAALPLLAERSAKPGRADLSARRLGMPATLRKQRQRCRCSRRGPRAWAR
ncbi:Hypothetical predicted protein [Podarcis lilfordi]|uniref:Uncharacterized protein n=1 Tax=Podarcis lilfordi TaxID=74358 RepID=A0AA35PEW7_9SAUR|nr:Hypothetical predicted protein [Podarcis lilfordi]